MADEPTREPHLIQTELRYGERRQCERRRHPRLGPDRRRRQRRGRTLATAGLFLSTLGLYGAPGQSQRLMQSLRGSHVPLGNVQRPALNIQSPFALPSNLFDQSEVFVATPPNDAVLEAIQAYSNRADFGEALSRGGRYLPKFAEILSAARVPPELAYLGLVESEFRPEARSWCNAFGVWQFMPDTGKQYGLKQTPWIDERGDPIKGAEAAAKYLRYLYDLFHDWNLAMAAYNAGEGTVAKAIARYHTTDFWELARRRALPQETRDYVPRILAAITIARDPERYGVTVSPESELITDTVQIDTPVDLQVAARCLSTDAEGVLALNPELKRPVTPLEGEFLLKVPAGRGDDVAACLARLPPDQRVRIHKVERGQTLSSVAHIYGTHASRIAEVNALNPKRKLAKGLELVIPMDE